MKSLLLLASASTLAAAALGTSLQTDYTQTRSLVMTATTSLEMETTVSTMEVDGEPVDRGGFGGGASLEERTVEQTYQVLAHSEGKPTKVRRAFGTVTRATTSETGDRTSEGGGDGPLAGVVLELTLEDGETAVEVVDGSEPDQESCLEGHGLTLAFDGLLPEGEVEADESWELSSEAIQRALGLDREDAYFPREEADQGDEGGRRRGRRDRGSALRSLIGAEWEGEATFQGETDHDGVACYAIGVEFEASGELPETGGFGRGGRGGRALGLPAAPAAENTITAELEGRLLFSKEDGRPVLFEVEGSVSTVRDNEFERGESMMRMRSEQEGTLELRVEIAVESE